MTCKFFLCSVTSDPPESLDNTDFSLKQITYSDIPINQVLISNQILVNNHKYGVESTKEYFQNSRYCPENFAILTKEELDTIISDLGSDAYSKFTDQNGLDLSENIYYLTNTKGIGSDYNKMFMILKNNAIQFEDIDPVSYIISGSTQKFHTICKLNIPEVKIVFPENKRDFDYNTELQLKTNFNDYYTDFIWKINNEKIKDEIAKIDLTESGVNNVEFWGKYFNGETIYLCDIFYVSKEKVSSEQEYDDSKVKKITTNFKIHYNHTFHFTSSNFPIAQRDDGGYYVAVSNPEKYLHILSFDKGDNLIKDFDTGEKAKPHDITATYLGFAVYVVDASTLDHSYITVYTKKFEFVNRVQVMNNENTKENQKIDSTPDKQLIRYNSQGKIQYGIRFIYQADNAKLLYSRGRIFLIFAHYNIFDDDYIGHTADTVVTFNDNLEDTDFGKIFGASHSLIQSATFDDNYFWTASLSDAYPEGIRVEYTSKKNFQNDYDAVFQKNNIRVFGMNDNLAGYIKGYHYGWADGKLGGILYFEKFKLYCLVYAKAKENTKDNENSINIISMTTWKFINDKIEQITTKEIKYFDSINIMQVRAGRLGDDKVFITYLETNSKGHSYYGNIPKGSVPKVFVIKLPNFEYIKNDAKIDDLLMNTNEDLRTIRNGVLIWGSCDADNNLVLNKIGDTKAVVPSVTWKDIYKLKISETKTINDEEVKVSSINMRGITSSAISIVHKFIIYLIFQINSGLRNLQGNDGTIRIEAICSVLDSGEEITEGNLNMIDYECIGKEPNSVDLSNYKLINIEEGNNEDSLKESNMNNLVNEIKETHNGNLNELKDVTDSTFTKEKFDKIVVFKMNEIVTSINAQNYKFQFTIDGKLNKEITNSQNTLNREFELAEIDTNAICTFNIGQSRIASLSCDLNVENHKNISTFSFKTSEIMTDNNEIFLSRFNDISLINSKEINKEEDDDNKKMIIAVSVVCSVVAAAGIAIGIYFLIKKLKLKNSDIANEEIKVNSEITKKTMAYEGSKEKVIEFKNMEN